MIRIQKSALSFTAIFLSLIVAFLIILSFSYTFTEISSDVNTDIPSQQQEAFTELNSSYEELDLVIKNVSESVNTIRVETGVLQTFWNSFIGLGNVLQIPIALIDVGTNSVTTMLYGTTVLPGWLQALLVMVVIIMIALAIVAAMTGGNSNV